LGKWIEVQVEADVVVAGDPSKIGYLGDNERCRISGFRAHETTRLFEHEFTVLTSLCSPSPGLHLDINADVAHNSHQFVQNGGATTTRIAWWGNDNIPSGYGVAGVATRNNCRHLVGGTMNNCGGPRILVVGKHGFIATSLARHLLGVGMVVDVVGRPEVDFLDDHSVGRLVGSGSTWDALIFTPTRGGRRTSADGMSVIEDNLHMHRNMLRLLPLVGVSFIFGSGAEFGRHRSIERVRSSELGDVMPRDPYGLSKALIALDARRHAKVVNLRLFNCFGPGEADNRMMSAAVSCALRGEPVTVHQDREFDFFWVEDLGRVVVHYLSALRNGRMAELPGETNCVYNAKLLLTETVARIVCAVRPEEPACDCGCVVQTDGMGPSYSGWSEVPQDIGLGGWEQGVMGMIAEHRAVVEHS
jgi:nucleoside-diphosphate-sugar epimerase